MSKVLVSPKVLLSLSGVYMALVAAFSGALFLIPTFPTFVDGDRMAAGCYITEAFFAGPACHGFQGSPAVALLLQLPFYLVLAPVFGLSLLASGELEGTVRGVFLLALTIALWAPLVYVFRYARNATQPGIPADGSRAAREPRR